MNFQEIEKEYPKAFAKYKDWYIIQILKAPQEHITFGFRCLYDFFDSQDIIINVFYTARWINLASNEENEYVSYFDWDIYDKDYNSICSCSSLVGHSTRTEAEPEAFLNGFDILEDRI